MDTAYLQSLVDELHSRNVIFDRGLSDAEVSRIESTYEFRFPPDLLALLEFALPISEGFPNWRRGWIPIPITEWRDQTSTTRGHNLAPIHEQLDWPARGICFDIEHNDFWMDEWGAKPKNLDAAFALARKEIALAPKLIPVYSHRFLPSEPCDSGNPVFSVFQTDIIYYGFDLASYFANEFKTTRAELAATQPREITFWSKFAG